MPDRDQAAAHRIHLRGRVAPGSSPQPRVAGLPGRGYELILELGGEKTPPQLLRCIRPGGKLAMIGILSGSAMTAALGHRDVFEALKASKAYLESGAQFGKVCLAH